ncbi:MAG: hypothetical protein WA144_15465 [Candidatus Methanoperedens sp.]
MVYTIDPSEIPEYQSLYTMVYFRGTDQAVGVTEMVAPGHHPKYRMKFAWALPQAYSTATDVLSIEEVTTGTDHATVSAGTTVNIKTAFTITDDVFERNEGIAVNLTTDGNAANATWVIAQFESIH